MESFLNGGSTMVILVIIVACGFAARKFGWMNDEFDSNLSKIVVNITCPALIFSSVLNNPSLPEPGFIANILFVSAVTFVPVLAVAWFAPKIYGASRSAEGSHQFTIAFGNTGFIGFAVVGSILDNTAVLYASMYNIVFNLALFSFGAYVVARSGTVQTTRHERLECMGKALISPAMLSCVIALVLAMAGITDNDGVVGNCCDMLGAMTPPASMMIIGSTLAKYNFREMVSDWRVYPTALLRLLGAPAIMFFVGSLLTSDTHLLAALTLETAMPAAAMGSIFCIIYGGDLQTMSKGMFLTTLLSIVTIPLVSMFVLPLY